MKLLLHFLDAYLSHPVALSQCTKKRVNLSCILIIVRLWLIVCV